MNRLFRLAGSMGAAVLALTLTPALTDRPPTEAWRDRPGKGNAAHLRRASIPAMSAVRHV